MSATDRSLLLHLFKEAWEQDYGGTSEADFFEIFVPYHYLKHYELDYSDIEEGIVDGAHDGGVDSVYCLCDGRLISDVDESSVRKNANIDLYIFTNKFQNSFPTGVLNDVRVTLNDLLEIDEDYIAEVSSNYNDDINDVLAEFRAFYVSVVSRFPQLKIHLIYATTSATPAKADVTSRLAQICSDLEEKFSGVVVRAEAADARTLLATVREPAEEVRSLQISGNSINQSKGPSYVALSRLPEYFEFICRPDGGIEARLFDDNVRDYEGDVGVNKEIGQSLESEGGPDFWWLNNGASIICDSATLSGNKLQMKNPKIVNGLQTSRRIYEHFANGDGQDDDDRLILVRIITAEDESVRAEIIRATNRQTPIAPAQLIATSAVHKDIELYLRTQGIFYERRKNYWKNQGKNKSEIVTITDLAQAMITVVAGRPNTARARPGSLLKEANNLVFDPSYDVKIYARAVELLRSTDALIQDVLSDCGRRDRNNIKFQVAGKIVLDSTGGHFSAVAFQGNELVSPDKRKKIVRAIYAKYLELGGTDRVAKSEEFWSAVKSLAI